MKLIFSCICIFVLLTTCLLTLSSFAELDPETYIGVWKFDEGNGDVAKDSTENEHDGQFVNDLKWVEGKFGDALEFDGQAYIDLGNAESLQFDGSVTIVYWALPENVGAGRQNTVCKSYGGEGCLTQETNGTQSFYWGDCGGNCEPYVEVQRPPAGTVVSGEWIHIAHVRNVEDRQYKMYKNGEVVAQGTWNACGGHPCGDSKPSNLNLYIGNGYAGRFIGILDEVAIIASPLEEDDIQRIMDNGFDELADVVPSGKLATTWGNLKR